MSQQEQRKFVAKTTNPPKTWHKDPDCGKANTDLVPLEGELPNTTTACTTCADGITPGDLEKLGESNA